MRPSGQAGSPEEDEDDTPCFPMHRYSATLLSAPSPLLLTIVRQNRSAAQERIYPFSFTLPAMAPGLLPLSFGRTDGPSVQEGAEMASPRPP
jgi:hypothetical protein